ncbi:hypothetical protein ACVBYC_002154 [Vibrio parahaemolyticus]
MNIILSDKDFIISDVKVEHHTPVFYTEGLNFVANSKERGLHRLNIECDVHFSNVADIKAFQAFLLRVRGRANPFTLSLQDETDGKGFCNPMSSNVTARLGSNISIGNTSTNLTGVIGQVELGSLFQFENDTKVYTVIGLEGNKLEFYPASRKPHLAGEPINFKPMPLVRLSEDKHRLGYEVGSKISLKMWEVM